MIMKKIRNLIIICSSLLLVISACKRDEYYIDGGKANPNFDGDMMQYLETKAVRFDTIAQIVKLAGLEETFHKDDFTFFAPDDGVIKNTIGDVNTDGSLNQLLFEVGRDTVKKLSDINPLIWKKYLQRYMFAGVNRLKDYPQIDFELRSIYPGALYFSYSGNVMNIGVTYDKANGVKYLGPRTLQLSYIPDISKPDDNWFTNYVASSDIKPKNGVVHALGYKGAVFGFDAYELFTEIYNTGLNQSE